MNGYHVDWVGAISAARFYLVLGLLMAAFSLALRELLRVVGI
jgi:hypothetical protein